MVNLQIKTYPDPCLRIKTKLVEGFTREIESVLRKMRDIMYAKEGIGLAAAQVGLGLRLLVIDVGTGPINLVNPAIMENSKEKTRMEEGCLSLPGITVEVLRPQTVKVRAQNEHGEFFIKKFDALAAKAVQHEIDHLDGRLIIDYLNPFRYFIAVRKLAKGCSEESPKTCEVMCNAGKRYK